MELKYWTKEKLKPLTIEKSEVPILFLDSNIIIELKKAKEGKNENIYFEEYKKLLFLLENKQQEGKLYCALGEQAYEIGGVEKKYSNVDFLHMLTKKVKLKSALEIEKNQLDRALLRYLKNYPVISINYMDGIQELIYSSKEISDEIHKGLDKIIPRLFYKELREKKNKIAQGMNENKKSEKFQKDFFRQLVLEVTCEARYLSQSGDNSEIRQLFRYQMDERIKEFLEKGYFQDQDIAHEIYLKFLNSFDFFQTPYIDIDRNISAYFCVMQNKSKPSDFIDQRNAAAFLPYVNIFVTDKAFCNCIKDLSIDQRYKTIVYDVRDLKKLLQYIENL